MDDLADIRAAVEVITSHFRVPLEAKCVSLSTIQDEVEEAVHYAISFLSISQETHKKIWYQLHTVPDSSKWPNMLQLTLYRPRMRVIACTRATAINPRYRVVLASLAVARKRYRFLCDRRPACVQRSYQDEELPSEELILTCHAYATRNSAKKNG